MDIKKEPKYMTQELFKERPKLTIKTSGFVVYLFIGIIAMSSWMLYISLQGLILKGFDWRMLLGVGMWSWMLFYSYRFLTGQKIEIDEDTLTSQYSFDGGKST